MSSGGSGGLMGARVGVVWSLVLLTLGKRLKPRDDRRQNFLPERTVSNVRPCFHWWCCSIKG